MAQYRKMNYVVESNIRGFFNYLDHEWLMRMLSHDIADKRFLEIIEKFLKVGIMEKSQYLDIERRKLAGERSQSNTYKYLPASCTG